MIIFAVLGVLVLGFIAYCIAGFRKVPQSYALVVERLGKYHRTLYAGIHIVWPFIETEKTLVARFVETQPVETTVRADQATLGKLEVARPVYKATKWIDLREQVLNFPQQGVITKDNVPMTIDAVLFYQILDPKKAIYEVANLPYAIEMLAMTTLRSVVGEMDLDETLSQRERINERLRQVMAATDKWGVQVTRVEIQEIKPPPDVQEAMIKQMQAERDRRARVTAAEAERQALMLQAEGTKDKEILEAEGKARARLRVAEAEAQALRMLAEAIGTSGNPTTYLIALKYLDALAEIARGQATKIFLPVEATGVLGALAGIKEMFTGEGWGAAKDRGPSS
jgi:regulator of protease activity HflC (stomatin/prohibitin superfamily)